jgi:hypothetical protein
MNFSIPLGNGLIIRKTLQSKKMLAKTPSAWVHMCVKTILQLVFHEVDIVKCSFVFDRTKNLSKWQQF